MPEGKTLRGFLRYLKTCMRNFKKKKKRNPKGMSSRRLFIHCIGSHHVAHFKLYPRTFAEGTSTKSWQTATVRVTGWTGDLEPKIPEADLDEADLSRSNRMAWEPLYRRHLEDGEMIVKVRGKELAVACGFVRSSTLYSLLCSNICPSHSACSPFVCSIV